MINYLSANELDEEWDFQTLYSFYFVSLLMYIYVVVYMKYIGYIWNNIYTNSIYYC